MNVSDSFKDPELCKKLLEQLHNELDAPLRFMEVCGTHTVAIFQSGLRQLLPKEIVHLSGPGCPVCVTHESEVAAFLDLAEKDDVIIATFGDLMRVPGPKGRNLKLAKAEGARIEIVYSPLDALKLAQNNPNDTVVFLGVGFETTAPTIAASIMMAKQQNIANFKVLSFHKLVPPALKVLLDDPECAVDAFLLPGHVSTILGMEPYHFVAERYNTPGVITGFDPVDILESLLIMVEQRKKGKASIVNQYKRAVSDSGNARAREIMFSVFDVAEAQWRGVGTIPDSGLVFNDEYAEFDALKALNITLTEVPQTPGCKCGEVLKGKMQPNDCPLFAKACTPAKPVGPCMVSTEGSCAAYFKYQVTA
ncbi:hydrogenase formation protein HypD [Halodesulfovibrio aestuarii]|uniref:Hydrogenase expression/formation protein HypD n=1 Tax=Halodesulfovibrio aestuarii TaxID=126333 RepID=A0A8G2CC74_9BACT|nr:hydrogenase formation protein HypD [Halodesulfovibrio aestuarii]SHJ52942.1 hydrogenase expression/formation protein HypD [Halodesulfovibrio aestuarii]